ncbi:bZIP transcription factor TGA10-like isoform X2 [Andrographis paniculata]|uniref:bZIP transcription factor TGA10-like isoform X2 n=1 Tax=Andrographis paniculata TaxID=175694 RepID=UPI0021E9713B|nr:bZIP transcription factor TGA10-like isoform X2 [Andrographis paniculata]
MASASNENSGERKLFSYPLMAVSDKAVMLGGEQCGQDMFLRHHQIHNSSCNNINTPLSFGMLTTTTLPPSSSSTIPGGVANMETLAAAYEMGELDQALFLYLQGQEHHQTVVHHEHRQNCGMRPHTLNIFPSQPMHVEPSKATTAGLLSPSTSGSKKSSEPSIDLSSPRLDGASASEPAKAVKREESQKGPASSSDKDVPKTPDAKTLRRLAQNREAARKSRLRKKAYIQQLESSRVRLVQLEQEVQRAKSQGFCIGSGSAILGDQLGIPVAINSDAAAFDVEYARWLEEHHRQMMELRRAVDERLPENEVRAAVETCLAHIDQMMNLKSLIAKSDVFHLLSGAWRTPAERCFLWMGGFRPSELIKTVVNQIQPLTEQQVVAVCALQQSTQEAEEALSQGLDALHAAISETIAGESLLMPPEVNSYMSQMAVAINKLQTLEGFIRQADNLRQQTLHRLHHLLTVRQAARCFLAIAEYFHRLRALSSLWLSRPRSSSPGE